MLLFWYNKSIRKEDMAVADSSKDIRLRELNDTIQELKEMISRQTELISSLREDIERRRRREEELLQREQNYREQIDYLTKKLFAPKKEKRNWDIPGQLSLFNEAEAAVAAPVPEEDEQESGPVQKPKKKRVSNEDRFKGLPVEKKYLDVPEDKRICSVCGTAMEPIGEEFVRREIHIVPPKITVTEYYSRNYGCRNCRDKGIIPHIVKGKDGKPHMLHGMASAQTVAYVMYQKFAKGLPLYRQEKDYKTWGMEIPRATLGSWIIKNSEDFLTPMYDYFRKKLLERQFVMADETPLQVLKEPDRAPETKSYMWLFRTGEDGGPPVIIYKYSETRAGNNAVDFLDGYSGYLMCDGYSGYNNVRTAKRTACWAHIRRYLLDAVPKGHENDYSHPAVQGALYINKLFELEREIKKKHPGSYDAIKKERNLKERPVLKAFWSWLDMQHPVSGSRMEKAVVYAGNRRDTAETYLEDGRCSFSNNLSENCIRLFVIGRKGWLFADTPAGAQASAVVYTVVEMAKAHEVNAYYYLTYLLERLPGCGGTDEELEKLAPWSMETRTAIGQMIVDAM